MENEEWIDQLRSDNTVLYSEAVFGEFKLVVHHYMSFDDDYWVASCEGVFDKIELRRGSILQAKAQAKAKLHTVLYEALCAISLKKE
jgi:beta-glucosidase/6-phospho-beta-glucosidase/beta-galactosidase